MGKRRRASSSAIRAASSTTREARNTILAAAILIVLTFAVYARMARAEFLTYDDDLFVTQNQHVLHSDVAWAFTSAALGYYPLTWISHMLDVGFFGLDAGAHHLMNVALHAVASAILFLALQRMTSQPLPSAIVAALFAVHPTHVESVAWIAERRDTLSALFAFLALLAYPRRMGRVIAFTVASLLSKQTLVTMPLLLLIVDDWPLKRGLHVREKLPLLSCSVFGAVAALVGQKNLAAVQTLQTQPIGSRITNALVSYAAYAGKTFWPAKLAIIYPLRDHAPSVVIASAAVLLAITVGAWLVRDRVPCVLAGWLWFVIALVPMIGIVQLGRQAMADRYTYIPSVGLFIAIVFATAQLVPRNALAIGGAVIVLALSIVTFHQTQYWHDTTALFEHSIRVTGPNPWADYPLGQSLQFANPDAALPPLRRAAAEAERIGMKSYAVEAHVSATVALLTKAEREQDLSLIDEAEREMNAVRRLEPNERRTLNNEAYAQQLRGRLVALSTSRLR